jgi:hypothetical protein
MHFPETQHNNACSRKPQPPLESTPLRFLDLPKDIRLLVYDYLPVITCHHTITALSNGCSGLSDYSLTIVSHRLAGISLLGVCRTINTEAFLLQRNITALNDAPLRIRMHWQNLGGTAI